MHAVLKTKRERREERFQTFCSDVTLHGFRYLFEGSAVRRCGWVLICLLSFVVSFLLFYNLVEDYLDRKTITSNFVRLQKDLLDFPTITVCPLTSRSASKLHKLSKTLNVSMNDYLNFYQNLTTDQASQELFSNPKVIRIMNKLKQNNMTTPSQILFNHHFCGNNTIQNSPLSKTLEHGNQGCTFFQGKPCPVERIKCSEVAPQSVCFKFNWYDINKPSVKSPMSLRYYDGFQMHLDLSDTFNWEEDTLTKSLLHGVVITIEPYGKPYKRFDTNLPRFELTPGTFHVFKMQEKRVKPFINPINLLSASHF